jgi:transcriptional regulator with XRE-family HTH domain
MRQTKLLISTLKKELKKQGKTYRDVAHALELSEASIKRLFSEQSMSLERLDKICQLIDLEFIELVKQMEHNINLISQLTLSQEQELVGDIKLLLMAHFLINGVSFTEVIQDYCISETQGIQLLAKLDRMKIIELLPGNRVKMMISTNFQWIENGPIQGFYRKEIQPEFFNSPFADSGEFQSFVSGMLSRNSNAELIKKVKRLVGEFNQLNTDDQPVQLQDRFGTSLHVAIRPWEPSIFNVLRR